MRLLPTLLSALLLSLPGLSSAQQKLPPQGGQERVIQLESTVGLDPASCGEDSNLSLPSGTSEVIVCLTLSNNGGETLYLHQIVSEQLGLLEPAALYTLPAQTAVFYTYAVPLDGSTGLVSRWLAEDLQGTRYCRIAWSLVTVGRSMLGAHTGSGLVCDDAADY